MKITETKVYTIELDYIELMSLVQIVSNLDENFIPDASQQEVINKIRTFLRFNP